MNTFYRKNTIKIVKIVAALSLLVFFLSTYHQWMNSKHLMQMDGATNSLPCKVLCMTSMNIDWNTLLEAAYAVPQTALNVMLISLWLLSIIVVFQALPMAPSAPPQKERSYSQWSLIYKSLFHRWREALRLGKIQPKLYSST